MSQGPRVFWVTAVQLWRFLIHLWPEQRWDSRGGNRKCRQVIVIIIIVVIIVVVVVIIIIIVAS